MTLFQVPDDKTISLSKKIENAFKLIGERQPVEAPADKATVLKIDVRNAFANAFYLDCRIGDLTLLEHHLLEGASEEELGEVDFTSGSHELSISVTTASGISYVESKVTVPAEKAVLTIDLWDAHYPPNVFINDDWVNRPAGVEYTPLGELPELPEATRLNFYVVHSEYGSFDSASLKKVHDHQKLSRLAQLLGVDLDVWIDGERPCETRTEPAHVFGPTYHMEALPLGRHRLRIGDRLRNQLLLDSDVLINGSDDLIVRIDDPPGDTFAVAITQGANTLYTATGDSLAFLQGLSPAGQVFFDLKVGGHTLPDGLHNWLDEIRDRIKTQKRIRANYKLFLELRKAIREKKAAGKPLTNDEKAVDAVKNGEDLVNWVIAKKKKEGLDLGIGGTTTPDGKVTVTDKKLKTPFDHFGKLETKDVHEASHVRQFADLAKKVAGFDYEKYKEYHRLRRRFLELCEDKKKGKPVDEKELDEVFRKLLKLMRWALTPPHDKKVKEFDALAGDLDRMAQNEIDEYAAGIKFMSDVIRLLESQKFWLAFSPSLVRVKSGREETISLRQKPDAPPRIRVVEGAGNVKVTGPDASPGTGGTLYKIKVKGTAPGRARIEVICGTLRYFIVVTVR